MGNNITINVCQTGKTIVSLEFNGIKIDVGTELYNRGDTCNQEHFGIVSEITFFPSFGYYITVTNKRTGKDYDITPSMVSKEYLGNGLTRIVTKEAYFKWRHEKLKRWQNANISPERF